MIRKLFFSAACLLLILVMFLSGCTYDDGVKFLKPEGEVDITLAGSWQCIRRTQDANPSTNDLERLYMNVQGFGSYVMVDSSDGNFEWACKDGYVHFVGFPISRKMAYTTSFNNDMTLIATIDSARVTYDFLRIE